MSEFSEMPDAKKAAIEAAVKERATRDGFNPDEHWFRYRKVRDAVGNSLLLSEIQKDILDEMHRRGWEKPAELDYDPSPVKKSLDVRVDVYYGWHTFSVVFGNSEGIYINWEFHIYNKDKRGFDHLSLGSFKTLGDSLGDAEQMGLLAGRLTWLAREIYP